MLTAVQRVARGGSGGPALICDDGAPRPKPRPAPAPKPKPKRQPPKTAPPTGAPWRGPGPGGRVRTPNWENGKRRARVAVSSPAPPLLALGGSPITKSPVLFQDTPPAKYGQGEDWSTLKRALPPAKQQPEEWSEIKRALDSKKHEIASIRETQKSIWNSELAALSSTAVRVCAISVETRPSLEATRHPPSLPPCRRRTHIPAHSTHRLRVPRCCSLFRVRRCRTRRAAAAAAAQRCRSTLCRAGTDSSQR